MTGQGSADGPAIAGLLVARIGVAAVFALNTATFLLYAIVVAYHPQLGGTPQSPKRFIPGLRQAAGTCATSPSCGASCCARPCSRYRAVRCGHCSP